MKRSLCDISASEFEIQLLLANAMQSILAEEVDRRRAKGIKIKGIIGG